ncbi:MAG: hypothetical protein HYR64_10150 [Fimbriimonas ginsengisoli]|uniref:Uncharacterized protein n=1 Tax=Fimbriimonas ginsengisoli TaxID=1005039 RepID=A0A931PUJ1_FIMGI|nr:hypothetical protein [Fimbriimonas ginsengisoli]
MLPLLPALLMLILHGPTGAENLAANDRVPEALRVLGMRLSGSRATSVRQVDRANALELARGQGLSHAVMCLIAGAEAPTETSERPELVGLGLEPSFHLDSGHFECRRSRDGPAIR